MTIKGMIPEGVFVPPEDLALGKAWCNEYYGATPDYFTLKFWENYLTSITLSCFKWENVPAGIDTRAIDFILLNYGIGGIFEESGGFMFASAGAQEQLNMYYNPNKIILLTPNGEQYTRYTQAHADENGFVVSADCAICFDNLNRQPIMPFIQHYAKRLARTDTIIDMNIDAQSQPWLIAGNEESKGNTNRIIKKLEKHERFIRTNARGFNTSDIQVLNTMSPYVADKLTDTQKTIIDTFLTFIGCDNSNTDKKERVNVEETLSNNEQIQLMRNARLKPRQEFCKQANVIFGLDMKCTWSVPHLAENSEALNDGIGYEEESEVL